MSTRSRTPYALGHTLGGRSDAVLVAAVRAGDISAYGDLYARHSGAARRLARQLASGADADDLVSEAFAKVLGVLQRGGGPDASFRAYLLTTLRRVHVDRIRGSSRLHPTDDLSALDPGVPFDDPAIEGFETAAAARAFESLPERWRRVLWLTEVEGRRPAEVASLLAMSPNAVSALAHRAREGLRQAYLAMHTGTADDDECQQTRAALGGYVRGGLSRREETRVAQHLDGCRPCTAIHLELTQVNSGLRGTGIAAVVLGLAGRARDAIRDHVPAAAATAAAAAAVVVGGLIIVQPDNPPTGSADPPTGWVQQEGPQRDPLGQHLNGREPAPRVAAHGAATKRNGPAREAASGTAPQSPATSQAVAPSTAPSTAPPSTPASTAPATAPSSAPSTAPSSAPSSAAPSRAPLVDVSASVSAGDDGLGVGLGLGIGGATVIPSTTVGVP